MFSYFDENYIYAGDTILLCTSSAERLTVPAKAGSAQMKKIGDGAFADKNRLKNLVIEEGIEAIGTNAFSGAGLESITLPESMKTVEGQILEYRFLNHLEITERIKAKDLETLLAAAYRLPDRRFVLWPDSFPRAGGLAGRFGMTFLELEPGRDSFCQEKYFFEETAGNEPEVWDLSYSQHGQKAAGEAVLIRRMLDRAESFSPDPEEEKKADWYFRTNVELKNWLQKRAVMYLKEDETVERGSECIVRVHVKQGYCFWPHLQRIVVRGKDYYIYSRYYESRNGLARADFAVLDEKGKLAEGPAWQDAYAKYKFLSLL